MTDRTHKPTPTLWVPIEQRFWARVESREQGKCWNWLGAKDRHGYGSIGRPNGEPGTMKVHRYSFELHYGYLPPVVRHKCDNPSCVNPHHLEAGTQADNVADIVTRRRHRQHSKDTCPKGHPYYRVNGTGERRCKECAKAFRDRRRAEQRAAGKKVT